MNKLRDTLGVKIDFQDEHEDKDKDVVVAGKKKKPVHSKAKVKITGRKENVEEAKKRILMHAERLVRCFFLSLVLGREYVWDAD